MNFITLPVVDEASLRKWHAQTTQLSIEDTVTNIQLTICNAAVMSENLSFARYQNGRRVLHFVAFIC